MASGAPPGLTGAPPGLAGAPPGLAGASAGAPPGLSASGGSVSVHLRSKAVSLPDGTVRTVGLVDAHWADPPLDLPAFLPADGAADAPVDAALEWADVRSAMTDGVDHLLSLPLGHFWSRVLYDESVLRFVDSMLRFAPRERRAKGADVHADDADADADDALLRRCLLLLRRLSTCHESESEYLDDAFWRESVYERWVFDAPKLIDLAAIYGFTNAEIVRAIVADVLRMQPRRAPNRAPTPPPPPHAPPPRRIRAATTTRHNNNRYVDDLREALLATGAALTQLAGRHVAHSHGGALTGAWALPLPSVAAARSIVHVANLASWLRETARSLHALFHVAPDQVRSPRSCCRALTRCCCGGHPAVVVRR